MKDKILYYPYINVPYNTWVIRNLLYWDEVGAIVPREFIDEPEKLSPEMREMVATGLVRQVIPEMQGYSENEQFNSAFIEMVKKEIIPLRQNPRPLTLNQTTKIHISKTSYQIISFLEKNNLALIIDNSFTWIYVETVTANLFMAYLSSFLSNYEENNMIPMTQSTPNLAVFSEAYPLCAYKKLSYENEMRIELFEDAIPVPSLSQNVNIREIAAFKERYGDLAKSYRKEIERQIENFAFIDDEDERKYQIRSFKERNNEKLEELVARYKERNWGKILFGSLCGLAAAAIPGVKAFSTGDISEGVAALPGLLGALYTAYEGNLNKQRMILESPLAYAFFVQRKVLDRN